MNLNVPVDDILAIPVANNSTIASHISLRCNIKKPSQRKKKQMHVPNFMAIDQTVKEFGVIFHHPFLYLQKIVFHLHF